MREGTKFVPDSMTLRCFSLVMARTASPRASVMRANTSSYSSSLRGQGHSRSRSSADQLQVRPSQSSCMVSPDHALLGVLLDIANIAIIYTQRTLSRLSAW